MHNVIVVQTGGFRSVDDNSRVDRDETQMGRSVLQMREAGRSNDMSGFRKGATFASVRSQQVEPVGVLGVETSKALG
jgi:hypothetical protein